jgi:16S rRNA (adenine1518-N6/adenine1519-N6)-dimethyltransferase
MKVIEQPRPPSSIVVMVQKEVAERIAAPPGGRDYGAVSVAVQYRCSVEYAMDVPKDVFTPRPGVDSAVLLLTPGQGSRARPLDEALFFALIKAGFGQRRKMLRNALASVEPNKETLRAAFAATGIAETARAETLSADDFIRLSNAIRQVVL